jgi:hypothetical protein
MMLRLDAFVLAWIATAALASGRYLAPPQPYNIPPSIGERVRRYTSFGLLAVGERVAAAARRRIA